MAASTAVRAGRAHAGIISAMAGAGFRRRAGAPKSGSSNLGRIAALLGTVCRMAMRVSAKREVVVSSVMARAACPPLIAVGRENRVATLAGAGRGQAFISGGGRSEATD